MISSPASFRMSVVVAVGSFGLLYRDVIAKLVHDWAVDDNYSHGFIVVPLALYFAWERRDRIAAAAAQPSWSGLLIVLASVAVLLAGLLGAELFLSRVSMIGVIAGTIVYVLGWRALRILTFALFFLLLMVPLPAIIFNQIAFPLQLLASRAGQLTLETAGIPVLREGNVITLANMSLEVAEACSGIRSLISLLTLGIVYAYFMDRRLLVRTIVVASTIPIAILSNAARVAGTGVAAHYYGPQAAEGFFHTFSGWLVFVFAFVMLFGVMRVLLRIAPEPHPKPVLPAASAV